MGGKHKQAQRTKANAKPSSSGRSAALLANASSSAPNFAAVNDCGYVPIFPCISAAPTEEFDAAIDSNFQLVLKKMNKKDSTTRLKALQEFTRLVGNSEVESVKSVLPFWPRLYCLLAGDVEHRVREAAQEAQRAIMICTRKNMAPYLRQVAGPWFAAQFDTYPPVATAATRAFQDSFPANKLVEAIMFCRDDILMYISENLLGQVSQSSNSAKNLSTEKLKARKQRIKVSCLQAFANFLRLVPTEQIPTIASLPIVENLVGSKLFWELASDKLPVVRSAWMCVLTAVLERAPQLLKNFHSQVVLAVLTRLDDSEPSVLPYVWEAALHVLTTIEDWENHCNVDKVVLAPLWQILKEAGHGTAASIFPSLLPVLNCLLKICKTPADTEAFCNQFFASLREGFIKRSVVNSRSESEAVAQCYVECVRYISSNEGFSPQQLIHGHLLSAVELSFTSDQITLSKALFDHISLLAQYWSENRSNETFSLMLQCFWEELANIYSRSLQLCGFVTTTQQVELCLSLKSPRKQRKRVRFGGEDDNTEVDLQPSNNLSSKEFMEELENLVHLVCDLYMAELKQSRLSSFIVPLSKLVSEFNTAELFRKLNPSCDLSDILNLIHQSWTGYSSNDKLTALELVLSWIRHLKPEDRVPTLWSLTKDSDMMQCVLRVARTHETEPHVREWLRSPRLKEYLLSLTGKLAKPTDPTDVQNAKNILQVAVTVIEYGELLVGDCTVSAILKEVSSMLKPDMIHAEFAARLCLEVCGVRDSVKVREGLEAMVFTIFDICCNPINMKLPASSQLPHAWQKGLFTLTSKPPPTADYTYDILQHYCKTIKGYLSVNKVLPANEINHLVCAMRDAMKTASSGQSSMCCVVNKILPTLEPEFLIWELQLMGLCMDTEKILGAIGIDPRPPESFNELPPALASDVRVWYLKHLGLVDTEKILGTTGIDLRPKPENYTMMHYPEYINFSFFSIELMAKTVFVIPEPLELSSAYNKLNINSDGQILKSDRETSLNSVEVESVMETDEESETVEPMDIIGEVDAPSERPVSPQLDCSISCERSASETMDSSADLQEIESQSEKMTGEYCVDVESVYLLQKNLIHAVCCVVLSTVMESDFSSLPDYSSIVPNVETIKSRYEKIKDHLIAAKATSTLAMEINLECWKYGGLWIWARYFITTPSRFSLAYADLKNAVRSNYGAQVLARISKTPLPHSLLDEELDLGVLASWIRRKDAPKDILGDILIKSLQPYTKLKNEELLRGCQLSSKDLYEVEKVSQMMHMLASCIEGCPHLLTPLLWDFIAMSIPYNLMSLVKDVETVVPHLLLPTSLEPVHKEAIYSVALCDLYCSLASHFERVVKEQDDAYLKYVEEWNEVFFGEVQQGFLSMFIRISKFVSEGQQPSLIGHVILKSLCSAFAMLDPRPIYKPQMGSKPVSLETTLEAAFYITHSSHQMLQCAAYHLIEKSLAMLVKADAEYVSQLEPGGAEEFTAEPNKLKMNQLLQELCNTKSVVDIMLADFKFGDSCLVEPHTETHHYTTAYLMLWDLLLHAYSTAGSELRYHYATIIKKDGFLESLLHHLFFLMPEEVLDSTPCKTIADLFKTRPEVKPGNECTSQELQHWACWVYRCVLQCLPALVRQWWGTTRPNVNTVVQRVTHIYISPLLCNNELQVIQNNMTKLKNVEVKVMMKAREVVATYALDETRMELLVTLPETYPLGTVQVNSNIPVGGTNQGRQWVRQLTIFLTHQNGSLWDGLLLWKSNLDKRFEGVEECYICFSILHESNFQIPKLCCKTCKKKFHSPCLYKWFSTSNKSTCPICRNMF